MIDFHYRGLLFISVSFLLPPDLNINDLVNASKNCDSAKLATASEACSNAVASSKTPCPPACADLFKVNNFSLKEYTYIFI